MDGCDDEFYALSLCRKHYTQYRQHGDPAIIGKPAGPVTRSLDQALESFFARLHRAPSGCLEWQGARNRSGYGAAQWDGRVQLTHRIAYQIANGPIPGKLFVCHHCDNPPCCEPTHLFLGDVKANHLDMEQKGRGFVPPAQRGESANGVKLTEIEVLAIRAARKSGGRPKDLAVNYGVSPTTIVEICKYQTWRHVA